MACTQDARIAVPCYENGFDDVLDVRDVFIKPNAHDEQWFYGLHDHLQHNEAGSEKAVRMITSRRYGDNE